MPLISDQTQLVRHIKRLHHGIKVLTIVQIAKMDEATLASRWQQLVCYLRTHLIEATAYNLSLVHCNLHEFLVLPLLLFRSDFDRSACLTEDAELFLMCGPLTSLLIGQLGSFVYVYGCRWLRVDRTSLVFLAARPRLLSHHHYACVVEIVKCVPLR